MDPGQPYSCTQWGNVPDGGSSQIVHDTGYDIWTLFANQNSTQSTVWIDHNMEVHYKAYAAGSWVISSNIDEMLEACGDFCIEDNCPTSGTGDVNADGSVNVNDIVFIVGVILGWDSFIDDCQASSADIYADGSVNVSDIVTLVDTILNT
jgi:hypothetical protein